MKGKIDEETIILPNQLNKVRHLLKTVTLQIIL